MLKNNNLASNKSFKFILKTSKLTSFIRKKTENISELKYLIDSEKNLNFLKKISYILNLRGNFKTAFLFLHLFQKILKPEAFWKSKQINPASQLPLANPASSAHQLNPINSPVLISGTAVYRKLVSESLSSEENKRQQEGSSSFEFYIIHESRSIVMLWRKVARLVEQRTSSRTISSDKWDNCAATMNASPTHMLSYLSLDGIASHRRLCSIDGIQSRLVFTLDLRYFLHCGFIPHFINRRIDTALRKCAAFESEKIMRHIHLAATLSSPPFTNVSAILVLRASGIVW